MAQYKLLRALPGLEAGAIFHLTVTEGKRLYVCDQEAKSDDLFYYVFPQAMMMQKEWFQPFSNLIVIDAKEKFAKALDGIVDPEEKRMIMGKTFIEVVQEKIQELGVKKLKNPPVQEDFSVFLMKKSVRKA